MRLVLCRIGEFSDHSGSVFLADKKCANGCFSAEQPNGKGQVLRSFNNFEEK